MLFAEKNRAAFLTLGETMLREICRLEEAPPAAENIEKLSILRNYGRLFVRTSSEQQLLGELVPLFRGIDAAANRARINLWRRAQAARN